MANNDEVSQAVNLEPVSPLVRRSQQAVYANGILTLLVLVALWQAVPHERLLAWAMGSMLVGSARWLFNSQALQAKAITDTGTTWIQWHTLGSAAAGLIWGAAILLLQPVEVSIQQAVIPLAIMAAVVTTTTTGYALSKTACLAFWFGSLLPLAIYFVLQGGLTGFGLGAVVLVYLATLYHIETLMIRRHELAASINAENRAVRDDLEHEHQEVHKLNQQLKDQTLALMESEARLRVLTESSFEGMVIHEGGIIRDANPVISGLLGYSHSELIGMPVLDLLAPGSRELAGSRFFSGYQRPFEVSGLHRNGTMVAIEIQTKTIPYKGTLVQMMAVRDQSERKYADQQAIILQMEKERVQMLASFLQNASHEFRTPLTIIMTALHLLKRHNPDLDDTLLNRIRDQIRRLDSLVESQLLLVRLDTRIELTEMPLSINEVLREAWEAIRVDWKNNEVQLEAEFADTIPNLQSDANLLRYAFQALLHNAIRFSHKGGSVVVTTASDDRELVITIADTGIGIDETELPRIFDRFYRGDEARTTAGFGLGLSIAQKIIQCHHGSILVQSQYNNGTTVTVRLPLDKPQQSLSDVPQ